MKIECPRCEAREESTNDLLKKGSAGWQCPQCRTRWNVRTVFFETNPGLKGKDWHKMIKRLRKEQGMTQSQVAELVGVTGAYISHIEAGKRNPAPSMCRRILEALGAHEEASRV